MDAAPCSSASDRFCQLHGLHASHLFERERERESAHYPLHHFPTLCALVAFCPIKAGLFHSSSVFFPEFVVQQEQLAKVNSVNFYCQLICDKEVAPLTHLSFIQKAFYCFDEADVFQPPEVYGCHLSSWQRWMP